MLLLQCVYYLWTGIIVAIFLQSVKLLKYPFVDIYFNREWFYLFILTALFKVGFKGTLMQIWKSGNIFVFKWK